MNVQFDSQIFCAQEFGGISRYFASMALEMHRNALARPLIVAPMYINEYASHLPKHLVLGRHTSSKYRSLARLVSLLTGSLWQRVNTPDVIHRTYYYPVPAPGRSTRTVLTVYDMIHEREPTAFSKSDPIAKWKARAVARADHIICISEHTRRDLMELLDVPAQKVSVTHLGYDSLLPLLPEETAAQFRRRVLGADTPYLLYVGARSSYKNFAGLLQAYATSTWLRQNFTLLCFGGGEFTATERGIIARNGVSEQVRQIGGPDDVLASSYRHAALFVYPSRYEGFGIPPLEAMSLDCPVACSNATSLPEVVGDAAASFDPSDPDSIRSTLESTLNESDARRALVERGRLQSSQFSWVRCAMETVKIYQETAQS